MLISLRVNGRQHQLDLPPLARLIDVLRDTLGLTGTKEGCGEGECGTCMVLLDATLVNACLVPIGQCAGRDVVTIEGLESGMRPSALARALVDRGGVQCGMCTPGMLVSAHALLEQMPAPSEDQIREWLSGNLCRCTGYRSIVQAVRAAASETNSQGGTQG